MFVVNGFVMEPGYPAPLTAEFMLPVAIYVDARVDLIVEEDS